VPLVTLRTCRERTGLRRRCSMDVHIQGPNHNQCSRQRLQQKRVYVSRSVGAALRPIRSTAWMNGLLALPRDIRNDLGTGAGTTEYSSEDPGGQLEQLGASWSAAWGTELSALPARLGTTWSVAGCERASVTIFCDMARANKCVIHLPPQATIAHLFSETLLLL
jgi:hypothetical protein